MTRSATLILLSLLAAAGCTKKNHSVPAGMTQPLAKNDFTVLGKTNHEECGTYIFAIDWGHLFANQRYKGSPQASDDFLRTLTNLLSAPSYNADESRALYHAADKMPEATHLLAARAHSTSSGILLGGYPIFGQRCGSVVARGVIAGTRPAIHNAPLGGGGGGGTGGAGDMVPVLDEEGNPVLDEEGNPVMGPAPAAPEGEGTEGAAPQ